jgi:hypothetical protein
MPRRRLPRPSRELTAYLAAGAAYVAFGVFVPAFLYSLPVAIVYLLLVMWGLPALWRRIVR